MVAPGRGRCASLTTIGAPIHDRRSLRRLARMAMPADTDPRVVDSIDACSPWRLSVAPMLDWTDRHCRYFHRLLTRRTRLYTEMVTTGALLHGSVARHLDFNPEEHPVALQLGGSEPVDLAHCAQLAERWGYDEVNLNCGCPSERVQRGAFGACLMAEPALVADCVRAMRDATALPVSVKHRIGIDRGESYDFVRDFVGTVAERGGCSVFIVHARNAWLKGLSPKENRELPPLRYEFVYRLKRDFPALTIVLNGGVVDDGAIERHLAQVDGVMLGREAYHHPWVMADWDRRFFGESRPAPTRAEVESDMAAYMVRQAASGIGWPGIARHMMGLWHGVPGARRWRQVWSDARQHALPAPEVHRRAAEALAIGSRGEAGSAVASAGLAAPA
jgi:tRNA-dihydrouridine synthase A